MVWGRRREDGSGWGTHVYLWWIHVDIWQNQYNIVKLKNKINLKKEKKKKKLLEENIGKTLFDIIHSKVRMTAIKKSTNNKSWRGYRKKREPS